MSILDFTTDLFRDPTNLRAFADDPHQALHEAGLPDASPEQVYRLLPVVAESMPPDHPLQAVAGSLDPVAALRQLDFDELRFDEHQHHHATAIVEKALGPAECQLQGDDDAVTIHVGHFNVAAEIDKGLGHVTDHALMPSFDDADEPAGDHYPDDHLDHVDHYDHDHALAHPMDLDIGAVAWGKAIE